jgi:hypothetical protein
MNAKNATKLGIGLTLTALALCGAMVLSSSCAGGGDGGGGGTAQGGTGGGQGGTGGGSTTPGNCPSDPGTSGTVNFCNGRAQGSMSGWGWVAMGALDTISDPTCDTDKHAITKDAPCTTQTNWNSSDGLCINASIPALPASPVQSDYDNNWGVQIGVNTSEPPAASGGTTLGGSYTKVTMTLSGSPLTGLRAMLHRKGDNDQTTYCANMTNGTSMSITAFNTKCWDGSGTAMVAADVPNIDKVGVQVSSTASAITVSALCLKEVKFE